MEADSVELSSGSTSSAGLISNRWTVLASIPVPVGMIAADGFPAQWNDAFRALFDTFRADLDGAPETPDRWNLAEAHHEIPALLRNGGTHELIDLGPTILELDVAPLANGAAIVVLRNGTERFNRTTFDEVVGGLMRSASHRVGRLVRSLADEFPNIDANATSTTRATERVRAAADSLSQSLTRLVERTANVTATLDEATKDTRTVSAEADREAKRTTEGLEALEAETRRMARWASSIGEIAHQTHILALNISVGASRVGEAGSEFAIIAKEVRDLANRTREISASIELSSAAVVARMPETLESLSALRRHISRNRAVIEAIVAVAQEQRSEVLRVESHVDSGEGNSGIGELLGQVAARSETTLEIVRSSSALLDEMKSVVDDIDFAVVRSASEPETTPADVFRLVRVIRHLVDDLEDVRAVEPSSFERKEPAQVLRRLADVASAVRQRLGIEVDLTPPRARISPTQVFIRARQLVRSLGAYFDRTGRPLPPHVQTEPPYRDKTPTDVYAEVDAVAQMLGASSTFSR